MTSTGTVARPASASTAGASPRSLSTAGWMPRASSRSSAVAPVRSSAIWSRSTAAAAGSSSSRRRATRRSSAIDTSRCWAPSCRSRSSLRRAASAAATIRVRDARSSSVWGRLDLPPPQRLLRGAPLRDVEQRAVEPQPPARSRHELPAVEDPAELAVRADDPVLDRERLLDVGVRGDGPPDALAIVGMDDAHQRPPRARDEVVGRIAGDPLDLVRDQLEPVAGVPGRAVDRARHGREHRPQQRVVGALLDGAQPRPHPGQQLRPRERPVEVVVGARLDRGLGAPAARRPDQRDHPRTAESRVLPQREARRGGVQPAGLAVDEHELRRLGLQLVERRGGAGGDARRAALGAQPRGELGLAHADQEHGGLTPAHGSGTRHGASVPALRRFSRRTAGSAIGGSPARGGRSDRASSSATRHRPGRIRTSVCRVMSPLL